MKYSKYIPSMHNAFDSYESLIETMRETSKLLKEKYERQVTLNDKLIWSKAVKEQGKLLRALLLLRFEIEDIIKGVTNE